MKHKYRGASWQWEFVIDGLPPLLPYSASVMPITITDRYVATSQDRTQNHGFRIAKERTQGRVNNDLGV